MGNKRYKEKPNGNFLSSPAPPSGSPSMFSGAPFALVPAHTSAVSCETPGQHWQCPCARAFRKRGTALYPDQVSTTSFSKMGTIARASWHSPDHLPPPKLPLGDPHKPMWEKADLLMCQVPARIIPWCRQAGPSRTEGGAHRAALGGAVDGQVRGKWCEKRFYFSMGSNRGENIVRHRPGEPMGSWEIHLKAF